MTEGRAQPSGARGGEERGVARRLASTVSVPSSSALRIAEAAPIWIAGVDATLPNQPAPAAKPTLTLPVDLPTAVVTAAAPAASFACVDIRQNPELIARLEQGMRNKAQKASQHISMAAQLRKDREEKEAQQKMVCAPVRGVQVAEPKRDVSSRAAAAPRAADRPRTQPKVVIEPLTGQASHPAKSALKKATSLKPARTEEERLNVSVRYAKETEVVDAHRKKAESKGGSGSSAWSRRKLRLQQCPRQLSYRPCLPLRRLPHQILSVSWKPQRLSMRATCLRLVRRRSLRPCSRPWLTWWVER